MRLSAIVLTAYILIYLGLRISWVEEWDQDQQVYMIFPKRAELAYYLFRPLSYVDTALTGMRFHIGPHL